jgi:hypothetical protein
LKLQPRCLTFGLGHTSFDSGKALSATETQKVG